jgi:hypothetical protein
MVKTRRYKRLRSLAKRRTRRTRTVLKEVSRKKKGGTFGITYLRELKKYQLYNIPDKYRTDNTPSTGYFLNRGSLVRNFDYSTDSYWLTFYKDKKNIDTTFSILVPEYTTFHEAWW